MVSIILAFLYSSIHFFSFILLLNRLRVCYAILGILLYSFIFIVKPDVLDLVSYAAAIQDGYNFEKGFDLLISFLKIFLNDERIILYVIQVILIVLFFYAVKVSLSYFSTSQIIVLVFLIMSSLAFVLGVNNAIRQSFAALFVVYSIYFFLKNNFFLYLLLILVSFLFHKSSILFFLYLFYIYFIFILYSKYKINVFVLIFFMFLFSLLFLNVINYVALTFGYDNYLNMIILENGRTPIGVKVISIFFVFVISELFLKHSFREKNFMNFMRMSRLGLIIICIAFSFDLSLSELTSRVLYYYFIIEMFLMLSAWVNGYRLFVVVIIIFYGFALNALHVIGFNYF